MKMRVHRPAFSRTCILCMLLALVVALCGVGFTLTHESKIRLPYAEVQLAAAKQMAAAEQAVLDYITAQGIPMEPDDLNQTGFIGPEWTELTTSLGMLEAKRTALQPDFAALMVKYYQEAGLQKGDTLCCGMSGSFPGLGIGAICAANQMGLSFKIIASYGSSMYGSTRLELPIVRILEVAKKAGIIEYEMLAASPGGDFDQGNSILFPDARNVIFELGKQDGVPMINEANIPDSVQHRLKLFGTDVDCFVNVGGASTNVGTSPYTLNFPNGLVTDPPRIPQDADRGLVYEYAARNVPVIHLLNVRGLAEDNGLPFDPVPLTKPGDTNVYYTTVQSPWVALAALGIALGLLIFGWKRNGGGGLRK
ncbi:MAG: poly-gamma-glutamate system protein [Clostridia bacterium]